MAKGFEQEHPLLDAIISVKNLRNDAELSAFLGYQAGVISKVRNSRVPISEEFRMRVMRRTGWPLKKLDDLAPLPSVDTPD